MNDIITCLSIAINIKEDNSSLKDIKNFWTVNNETCYFYIFQQFSVMDFQQEIFVVSKGFFFRFTYMVRNKALTPLVYLYRA